jgi:hypothetical protein
MTWSGRRKLTYFSLFIAVFIIVAASVVRHYTVKPATCFDGKRNGDETGIDCGGGCLSYCPNELSDPKIRWTRSFQIAPGVYTAVAYIEHNNPNAAVASAPYEFKLYDENNTLIATRTGSTYLGPAGRTAIVETLIQTGNATPAITRFSFTGALVWQKVGAQFSHLVINTDRTAFEPTTDKTTRLAATLQNESRASFIDLDAVAILYDANENAITAVKNLVPSLNSLTSKTVYFTWPFPISGVDRVEILPRINPYTTTLK